MGIRLSLKNLAIALAAAVLTPLVTAQEAAPLRPVASAYMVEVGSSSLTDTYLSPIKYTGIHLGLGYERRQAMKFDPERWEMRLTAGATLDRGDNIVRNATMWGLEGRFEWGMARRWQLPAGVTVAVGGSTGIKAGCLYNARNGNNPVSAKAAWTVAATGYASWRGRVWRLPVTLRYQPTLPVAGIFFAPDYGELYYEIYLGNHSGLVHPAWWGSYFSLDNLLTADLHLGATAVRLGYRCDILSTRVNNITTNIVTHSAVIGLAGEWISINPRKGLSPKARIISVW